MVSRNTPQLLSAIIPAIPLTAMFWLNFQRDKFEINYKKQEDLKQKLQELKEIKKDLIKQLYTTPHREVSICTQILISKKPEGIKNLNLELQNLMKEDNDEAKKTNSCRHLVRDNMEYIRHLLVEYSENIEETKELSKACGRTFSSNLLTHSDKTTLKKRYENFQFCKPVDDSLGYDDSIYDKEKFSKLLDSCTKRF